MEVPCLPDQVIYAVKTEWVMCFVVKHRNHLITRLYPGMWHHTSGITVINSGSQTLKDGTDTLTSVFKKSKLDGEKVRKTRHSPLRETGLASSGYLPPRRVFGGRRNTNCFDDSIWWGSWFIWMPKSKPKIRRNSQEMMGKRQERKASMWVPMAEQHALTSEGGCWVLNFMTL